MHYPFSQVVDMKERTESKVIIWKHLKHIKIKLVYTQILYNVSKFLQCMQFFMCVCTLKDSLTDYVSQRELL